MDHAILISKLVEFGVKGIVINLINYLFSGRKHYTTINGIKSEVSHTTCGVPLGTISGPKLFTILINGVKCSTVHNLKFVDDKTLVYSYSEAPTHFLQNVLNIETEETSKDQIRIN